MAAAFVFRPASVPVLASIPHVGTGMPPAFAARLTPAARILPDTDWHLDRLYDFLDELGVGVLRGTHSRLLVDLNRGLADEPLYEGFTTGLHPERLFSDGAPVWERPLADAEKRELVETLWQPYHACLAEELARLRAAYGVAVLFEVHSIRTRVPLLFAGDLPDFNVGTDDGAAADPALARRLMAAVSGDPRYAAVLDGRFKGGYNTRHYGHPERGVHAVQLELTQRTYMQEAPPFAFLPEEAARVRPLLRRFVAEMVAWAREASAGR